MKPNDPKNPNKKSDPNKGSEFKKTPVDVDAQSASPESHPTPFEGEGDRLNYLLTAYLFDNLSDAGKKEVEDQLDADPTSREELQSFQNTLHLLEDALGVQPSSFVSPRPSDPSASLESAESSSYSAITYSFDERRRERILQAARKQKALSKKTAIVRFAVNHPRLAWAAVIAIVALPIASILFVELGLPARHLDRNSVSDEMGFMLEDSSDYQPYSATGETSAPAYKYDQKRNSKGAVVFGGSNKAGLESLAKAEIFDESKVRMMEELSDTEVVLSESVEQVAKISPGREAVTRTTPFETVTPAIPKAIELAQAPKPPSARPVSPQSLSKSASKSKRSSSRGTQMAQGKSTSSALESADNFSDGSIVKNLSLADEVNVVQGLESKVQTVKKNYARKKDSEARHFNSPTTSPTADPSSGAPLGPRSKLTAQFNGKVEFDANPQTTNESLHNSRTRPSPAKKPASRRGGIKGGKKGADIGGLAQAPQNQNGSGPAVSFDAPQEELAEEEAEFIPQEKNRFGKPARQPRQSDLNLPTGLNRPGSRIATGNSGQREKAEFYDSASDRFSMKDRERNVITSSLDTMIHNVNKGNATRFRDSSPNSLRDKAEMASGGESKNQHWRVQQNKNPSITFSAPRPSGGPGGNGRQPIILEGQTVGGRYEKSLAGGIQVPSPGDYFNRSRQDGKAWGTDSEVDLEERQRSAQPLDKGSKLLASEDDDAETFEDEYEVSENKELKKLRSDFGLAGDDFLSGARPQRQTGARPGNNQSNLDPSSINEAIGVGGGAAGAYGERWRDGHLSQKLNNQLQNETTWAYPGASKESEATKELFLAADLNTDSSFDNIDFLHSATGGKQVAQGQQQSQSNQNHLHKGNRQGQSQGQSRTRGEGQKSNPGSIQYQNTGEIIPADERKSKRELEIAVVTNGLLKKALQGDSASAQALHRLEEGKVKLPAELRHDINTFYSKLQIDQNFEEIDKLPDVWADTLLQAGPDGVDNTLVDRPNLLGADSKVSSSGTLIQPGQGSGSGGGGGTQNFGDSNIPPAELLVQPGQIENDEDTVKLFGNGNFEGMISRDYSGRYKKLSQVNPRWNRWYGANVAPGKDSGVEFGDPKVRYNFGSTTIGKERVNKFSGPAGTDHEVQLRVDREGRELSAAELGRELTDLEKKGVERSREYQLATGLNSGRGYDNWEVYREENLARSFQDLSVAFDTDFDVSGEIQKYSVQFESQQQVLEQAKQIQNVQAELSESTPDEEARLKEESLQQAQKALVQGKARTMGGGRSSLDVSNIAQSFYFEKLFNAYSNYKEKDPSLTFETFKAKPRWVPPPELGDEGLGREAFREKYNTNPFVDTRIDKHSTFAMDVDTASFTRAKSLLAAGSLPKEDTVRVEEFVNSIPQDYPEDPSEVFTVTCDGMPSPFGPEGVDLLRVGIKARNLKENERRNAVLTLAIDASGSMAEQEHLDLIKGAMEVLIKKLAPTDQVALVAYSDQANLILPHTPARQTERILGAMQSLQPRGGTNVEAGLDLAYRVAHDALSKKSLHRVILVSDGVANVGARDPEKILKKIRVFAKRGIYLTAIGVGSKKYDDRMLERLANEGNGNYAYVSSVKEAAQIFESNLPSTLEVLAEDAKIQVEFPPEAVSVYRLLGYENRDIKDKDFRNDKIDAAEVGPGSTVTALYEVVRQPAWSGPVGKVFIRYRDTSTRNIVERDFPIPPGMIASDIKRADDSLEFLACVAELAELLRNSYYSRDGSLGDLILRLGQLNKNIKAMPRWSEAMRMAQQAFQIKVKNQLADLEKS